MQAPQPAPVPKQHRPCDGMVWNCKDKGTKSFAHMLDLQEYGVTKKWVIITEISKEVENNTITRVNAYARQYVSRGNVAAGGSNAGGGSSGRS